LKTVCIFDYSYFLISFK